MPALQLTPYTIPLALDALLCTVLAYAIWRRRPGVGVTQFLLMFVGLITWVVFYLAELTFVDLSLKELSALIEYVGITAVIAGWFTFIVTYIGKEKWLTRRNLLLLTIEPILVLIAVATNNTHHLFWATATLTSDSSFTVLATTKGILFWLHTAYSYALMLTTVILMLRAMIRYPSVYRGQVVAFLIGSFAPWVANGIYVTFGDSLFKWLDITPFAFTITCVAFTWSLLRFKLFDIVPVARETLIDSMGDAVLVLNQQAQIVDANRIALQMVGQTTSTAVIGKSLDQLIPGQGDVIARFRSVAEIRTELVDSQTHRVFELRISPIYNRNKDLTGRIVVLHDITELRRAADQIAAQNASLRETNQALEIARKEAEAANILKSQFLASMSHELRTPLNAVIGYTQLMMAGMVGPLTDKQMAQEERILINANHLLKLINDVLDLSKIEAGRMELITKPYNLRACFDEVLSQNKVLADQKGLTIAMTIDESLPAILIGDVGRVKQIAINLLSNAIKFTEKGTITIDVQTLDDQTWKITVTDTGIGIPSHMQETIFEEFRQVDTGSTRQYGGTGLGLAIVRRLAFMMGGNIRVSSQVGQGSTFTVTLPLIAEAQPVALPIGDML